MAQGLLSNMVMHASIELEKTIEDELNQALIEFNKSEGIFQRKILSHIRRDLSQKLEFFQMSQERRSYLLHQVSNTHSMEDLISLISETNKKQLSLGFTKNGLICIQTNENWCVSVKQ